MTRARLASIASSNVLGLQIPRKDLPVERVRRSVFRVLRDNLLCTIATVTRDSRAHIDAERFLEAYKD